MAYTTEKHAQIKLLAQKWKDAINEYEELLTLYASDPVKYSTEIHYQDHKQKLIECHLAIPEKPRHVYFAKEKIVASSDIKLHISIKDPDLYLTYASACISDLNLPIVTVFKFCNPLFLEKDIIERQNRFTQTTSITIYFKKAVSPKQIADTIISIEDRLLDIQKFIPIVSAGCAECDKPLGKFTSITIDKNAEGEYINGNSPEGIAERLALISSSTEIKNVQLWLTRRAETKQPPLKEDDMADVVFEKSSQIHENPAPNTSSNFFQSNKSQSLNQSTVKIFTKSAYEEQVDEFSSAIKLIQNSILALINQQKISLIDLPKGITSNIQLLVSAAKNGERVPNELMNNLDNLLNSLSTLSATLIKQGIIPKSSDLGDNVNRASRILNSYLKPMNPTVKKQSP